MTVQTGPGVDDLAEMVDLVWSSYLDPEGVDPLIPVDGARHAAEVHSSVSITGTWRGAVVFASSRTAARHAAAAFLAMDVDEVGEDDVTDVLGEIVNIVGGNVKAMLPAGCLLSLPHVVLASDTATRYPSAREVAGLHAMWKGEPVSITMWQSRQDEQGGEPA